MLGKLLHHRLLLRIKVLFGKYKLLALVILTGLPLYTLVRDLKTPPVYEATATIMTLSSAKAHGSTTVSDRGDTLLDTLSSVGQNGEEQNLLNILNSRTLTKSILIAMSLTDNLSEDEPAENLMLDRQAEAFKNQHTRFSVNKKTGLIDITIRYADPLVAATVANTFIRELQKYLAENSLTLSKRNRQFIEAQLENNKNEMMKTEKAIAKLYADGTQVTSNTQETTDQLKAELSEEIKLTQKKIEQIKSNSTYNTTQVEEAEKSVRALEQQLTGLDTVDPANPGLSRSMLHYLLLKRDMLKAIYALLVQQYELSKIDESKSAIAFHTIDQAIPPTSPVSPQIGKNFKRSLLISIFLCIAFIYVSESYLFPKGEREDPE